MLQQPKNFIENRGEMLQSSDISKKFTAGSREWPSAALRSRGPDTGQCQRPAVRVLPLHDRSAGRWRPDCFRKCPCRCRLLRCIHDPIHSLLHGIKKVAGFLIQPNVEQAVNNILFRDTALFRNFVYQQLQSFAVHIFGIFQANQKVVTVRFSIPAIFILRRWG